MVREPAIVSQSGFVLSRAISDRILPKGYSKLETTEEVSGGCSTVKIM
jgi:hypothetical protein